MPRAPPTDLLPPTPINLPRCYPQVPDQDGPSASGKPPRPLAALLQSIARPTEVSVEHLEALGTHVTPDATPAQLIPDPAYIPDFDAWHALSTEEGHAINESTRKRLNTGNLSPGCQTYLERRRELSIPNEAAYRTIRRIPPPKGQPQARLGNAYEFYRHLELFSSFWEDTSKPAPKTGESNEEDKAPENDPDAVIFYRTGAGHQMPIDYRQNIITAFLKLVAYDFTCNVSAPRTEPRLHITSNPPGGGAPRSSYFSSGCTFIFRSPNTREAARAGILEGPVAAVSARHPTSFPADSPGTDWDSTLDLARELVAALITAQHRAREGRTEKRVGEGAWWCSKPRWGGGPGGPIGREVEMLSGADQTVGDKDAPPPEPTPSPTAAQPPAGVNVSARTPSLTQRPSPRPPPGGPGFNPAKSAKRLKKSGNHPMYDNYRMVRPPAATWDRKTRYEAIGRVPGAEYDDVFVVSALLHHVSVLRVRVPGRLLGVLAGEGQTDGGDGREWGRLEVWRSRWFDFFKVEERVEAMGLVWCVMAWMMREVVKVDGEEGGDVKMAGA